VFEIHQVLKMNSEKRLLLVEDNEDDFVLMERALSKCGLKDSYIGVESGEEAIKFLSNPESASDIGLIVSDVKMAKINGFELHAWVRERPELASIPFALLTSSNAPRDREQARLAGISLYYVKPSHFIELIAIMQSLGNLCRTTATRDTKIESDKLLLDS
jgi:CheY-like chemotaxis protein